MIIDSSDRLNAVVKEIKANHQTIAVCNGSFDLLHMDHVELFRQAASKAEKLFVLVNSDRSVRKNKGPLRPILDEINRSGLIDAIKYVDYVYIFDDENPIKTLEIIKPDIYVSGLDYGHQCIEKDTIEKNGGKVVPKTGEKHISTTEIIEKILQAYKR